MPADEYSTGGGKLKLKGSKVTDGRVEKKKKKKAAKKEEEKQSQSQSVRAEQSRDRSQDREQSREKTPLNEDEDEAGSGSGLGAAKTETERKYEEVRRKRVCSLTLSILGFFLYCWGVLIWFQLHERLQREGVKTHKERVEELNTYLSKLSEHHDMYVPLSQSLFPVDVC